MANIIGTLKDSGNAPLEGRIVVELDAPLPDRRQSPHALHLTAPHEIPVVAGGVAFELTPSDLAGVTYRIRVEAAYEVRRYVLASDGLDWPGPVYQDGDILRAVGTAQEVREIVGTEYATLQDFRCLIPSVATVNFADLIPTGISRETLDTSIRRIADLLATDSTLNAQIQAAIVHAQNVAATPVGGLTTETVAGQLAELDAGKLAIAAALSELAAVAAEARDNLGLSVLDVATPGRVGVNRPNPATTLHVGGPVQFSLATAPPTDASLAIGEARFWLDEVTGAVRLKVRRGNGAIASGTIPLS